MQFKNVLAVAAIVGSALAANTSNNSTLTTATPAVTKACSFSDFTATASAQVQQVAACSTAVGDITVYGDAFGAVDITGVEQIYGNFEILNATQATIFNAPTLQLVSGELRIDSNTILGQLNLAQLTTVGTLTLRALPALEQTGLVAGITSAENITISDTGLTSLSGINVFKLAIFDVNNNKDIDTIDSGLQSVTNLINIAYNAEKVDVTLDELTTANTVYLQSINSFSFANLTTLNDSLTIQQSSIQNIEIKNLTTIGKSLTINDNVDLTDIEFPALTTIGGAFIIEDNTALNSITDFPKLKSVGGSVTVSGDLNNVTFASLNKVSGAFNLTSTGELSCNNFTNANKGLSVAGDTHCNGAKDSSSSSGSGTSSKSSSGTSTASSDSSGSSSSSSKKSDGTTASVSYLTSFMAAFMAVGVALY